MWYRIDQYKQRTGTRFRILKFPSYNPYLSQVRGIQGLYVNCKIWNLVPVLFLYWSILYHTSLRKEFFYYLFPFIFLYYLIIDYIHTYTNIIMRRRWLKILCSQLISSASEWSEWVSDMCIIIMPCVSYTNCAIILFDENRDCSSSFLVLINAISHFIS